jgi:probable rRNA maturation factor
MNPAEPLADSGEITISIEDPEWRLAFPDATALARRAVETALGVACPGLGPAGVAVVLVDDATVRTLNRIWRHKDAATNVLSFPATATRAGDPPPRPPVGIPLELGDVVVARETCLAEAKAQAKPPAHHVQHLIVHGVLHLLGYDHIDDSDAERMERIEVDVLARLGIPDPYDA